MFRLYRHLCKFSRTYSSFTVACERQKHGFVYQSNVIKKFNLSEQKGYTSEYDATYKQTPVQIKCSKYGSSLELGDYTRNKKKNKDFILAIGLWQLNDTYENKLKIITNEYMLYIEHCKYTQQLGYYNEYIETLMYEEFKQITNDIKDDSVWKSFCKKYKLSWRRDNKISIRFKRDHKHQKRIQCAISWSNFNDWLLKDFEHISIDTAHDYEKYENNHFIL